MSSNTGDAVAERQRDREGRGLRRLSQSRGTSEGPRQRRPALAALALLLIVGGALGAGLLALRMDSREPVIVAREDIPPGVQITEDMLAEARVATDSVPTIPVDLADQVVGAYSTDTIAAGELVPERALAAESPVAEGRAVVGVNLTPGLTYDDVKAGDLVRIFRISGGAESGGGGEVTEISQGLVLSTATSGGGDDLGGGVTSSTASVLVPAEVAGLVVDASGAGLAGLALTSTGQPTDVDLTVAEGASGGSGSGSGSTDDTDDSETEEDTQ